MSHHKEILRKIHCKAKNRNSKCIFGTALFLATANFRQTTAFHLVGNSYPAKRAIITQPEIKSVFRPLSKKHSLKLFSSNADKGESQNFQVYNIGKSGKNRALPLSSSKISVFEGTREKTQSLMDVESILTVISCSLLVTGNTVGAGMIVLPEVASEPGMIPSLILFAVIFAINLISGFTIAEVAIKRFEENTDPNDPAPSSFKDLAGDLSSSGVMNGANLVSIVSMMINWCVLSFDFIRSGEIGSTVGSLVNTSQSADLPPMVISVLFSVVVAYLGSTQSLNTLSRFAAGAVTLLFVSYGSLLIPGLAHMQHDVVTTLFEPGKFAGEDGSGSVMGAMSTAAPIILTMMVYQNIVPTVVKLMEYDRNKSFASLFLGSAIPVAIYVAWCLVVLGGGVTLGADGEIGLESILTTAFSIACIGGSSISCFISLTAEFNSLPDVLGTSETKTLIRNSSTRDASTRESVAPISSVLLAVVPSIAGGLIFANKDGFTEALSIAGSYGSPFLYGILPVLLAYQQREWRSESVESDRENDTFSAITQGVLGCCSVLFIAHNFIGDMCALL